MHDLFMKKMFRGAVSVDTNKAKHTCEMRGKPQTTKYCICGDVNVRGIKVTGVVVVCVGLGVTLL